jgi:hypothetical protein
MMVKLHKFDDLEHRYWEGWISNHEVVFHWGTVGDTGERLVVAADYHQDGPELLQRESDAKQREGFRVIDRSEMSSILINYRLRTWGNDEDLETRHYLEDLVDQALGWTGNGCCDGGEIGSGIMNIWCLVLEAQAAMRTLSNELRTNRLAEGALIAAYSSSTNNYVALWPESQAGQVVQV